MKRTLVNYRKLKKYLGLPAFVLLASQVLAQMPYNEAAPNGYTKKAVVSEQVGLTQVTVTYHRPAVNGREGKIWGGLVPKGFTDLGFGANKPAPWRAGANENTVIEFDKDVKIEGQPLAKGKYGFFIAYEPVESVVIFSKKSDAWGSFFYDEKDDALRVRVRPQPLEKSVEWLKYEFSAQTQNSAALALSWEKLSIPFRIEVDYLRQQFEAFVTVSKNPGGFTSQGMNIAAAWCLQNNYELEQGLEWAKSATAANGFGDSASFPALTTKALLLEKLGRAEEAKMVMQNALPFGNMGQLNQYGRQLLAAKRNKEALEVFQLNHNKNPNQLVTLVGLARGLSAKGDYAAALEFAVKALPLAPNEQAAQAIQVMIDKLKAGRDIN